MLTYELVKAPGQPLYESLYRCIRDDILAGHLKPGEKLPSKRSLAEHMELGKSTVEAAYNQLLSEGYISSREKVGYFVEQVAKPQAAAAQPACLPEPEVPRVDLTAGGTEHFPFSVWIRLQREVILDYGQKLLQPMPNCGIPELRRAIAEHLAAFRGMTVSPDNILVGAGTDFLYNLLIQLLGRKLIYGVEEPGYDKIRKIYTASGVHCTGIPMDSKGLCTDRIGSAQVLHISPNHHYPTGTVMPQSRRLELIQWVRQGERWIIEDDYDSEFRFRNQPLPTMLTQESSRVIYMNTFTKSLTPSIRISYMVLPPELMGRFRTQLGFYSCTVPSFEQYTLARFLTQGHFEKHINRMRKFYAARRKKIIALVEQSELSEQLTILERDAGLHFLLKIRTRMTDRELEQALEEKGVVAKTLSSFYQAGEDSRCLVINYSGVDEETMAQAIGLLGQVLGC